MSREVFFGSIRPPRSRSGSSPPSPRSVGAAAPFGGPTIDIPYGRAAARAVPMTTVVARARRLTPAGRVGQPVQTFGTLTAELLALADWLTAAGVRPVALDATGASRKSVYPLPEGRSAVLPVSAQHLTEARGRRLT